MRKTNYLKVLSNPLFYLILFFSNCIFAQNIISLNGVWDFTYKPVLTDSIPDLPLTDEFMAHVTVPAYWDDCRELIENSEIAKKLHRYEGASPVDFSTIEKERQGYRTKPLPYIQGVGYYRKSIRFPSKWKNKSVLLQIGGASQEVWIWLNGKFIGYHFGHSTKFEFPLNDAAIFNSENELVVAVSNLSGYDGGFMLSGYKGRSGGIYRDVELRITGLTHFDNCFLYPDENLETLNWTANISGSDDYKSLAVNWRLIDPLTGNIVKEGEVNPEDSFVKWKTDAVGIKHWSDRVPKLYNVELKLFRGNEPIDSISSVFGLRRLVRKGIDLYLNGEPIYLRGVTDHCYFPQTCTPPVDKNYYVDMIKRLKEVGFNWIRFHTWIPNEEYMQAADETGILLMVEAPGGYGEKEWIEIFETCRVHPSVVLYSGGNELLLDEQKIKWLSGIAGLQKDYVPDGLFNPQEALRGVEYYWRLSDLGNDTTHKPFIHNPERLKSLQEFSDVFGQYGWGHLSYFAERGDSKMLDERMVVYERPCLSHEVGIKGNYINLDHESRMQYTRVGTERFKSARNLLEQNGLIENASLYYNNSCRWLSVLRKQILENVRRSKYYRGYDFLGGHDHNHIGGGYEAGVLNEFFELKPGDSVDDLLKINGETVLLLDGNKKHNLKTGEEFSSPVLLSHWGNKTVKNGRVEWMLIMDNNSVLTRGAFKINDMPAGKLEEIGRIEFTVPVIDKAEKVNLFVRLNSDNYAVSNDWDYWIFPDEKPIMKTVCADDSLSAMLAGKFRVNHLYDNPNDIKIVSKLDTGIIGFIENGGTTVLLGNSGFPTHSLQYNMGLAGRTHGNLATVINNHPVTNSIPNDGWCSSQFRELFTGASTIVFNDLDIPFKPIIEVVSSYKFIIRQSCLFELSVGKGRLIICTLNFKNDDPASDYLLGSILNYAGNRLLYKSAPVISGEELSRYFVAGDDQEVNSAEEIDKDARNENKRGNIREQIKHRGK